MYLIPEPEEKLTHVCLECLHTEKFCTCGTEPVIQRIKENPYIFGLKRCEMCGAFNAPDVRCKLCNAENNIPKPTINPTG